MIVGHFFNLALIACFHIS